MSSRRDAHGRALVPGVNVDRVNIAAGLTMVASIGYTDPHTRMVIEYALQRHARGEEPEAERTATDRSFHGIDFTSWRMVLAAAVAHAEETSP